MPFLDHLGELRARLLRCGAAFVLTLGSVLMLPSFQESVSIRLFRWLEASLLPPGARLVFLDAFEPAWVILKVGLSLSIVALSPYILYEAFAFAAPAFARERRRTLAGVVAAGGLLFALGMAFAYFLMIPASLRVLIGLGVAAGGTPLLSLDRFYTFVLTMLLVFGVPFELPLVLGFLVRLRLVSLNQLRAMRRFVYLGIVILAAAITPDPTPFSQLFLSAALVALYELGLVACVLFARSEPLESLEGRYSDAA